MITTLIALCAGVTVAWRDGQGHGRALWIWHTGELIQDSGKRSRLFTFLSAPKGDPKARISVVFAAAAGLSDPAKADALRGFIADAHRRSVRVDYLCGEAYYATPSRMKEGLQQLEYVLQFNLSSPTASRFDGFQFDVEPYALPGWPGKPLIKSYLELMRQSRRRIQDSGQTVSLGAAIPRWFESPELDGLHKQVLDIVDYVAVMDYVDNAEHFVKDAANTVAYATRKRKDAWLGAEASELATEPQATFFRTGNAAMERAFAAAYRGFGASKGFAGVAVEHYDTYAALKP